MYFQYHSIPLEGWHKDSIYTFDIEVDNTELYFNIYINVRNTPNYPNQNLWLFISETTPSGTLTKDTIEFYLADHRGRWLGSGAGAIKEMQVLIRQDFRFSETGTYRFEITHGMRTDILQGITEIGMQVN
jgi:gliding motility-associated lipoprotein GldH